MGDCLSSGIFNRCLIELSGEEKFPVILLSELLLDELFGIGVDLFVGLLRLTFI